MLKMVDHVDQFNINDAILSANTFSVKEEQCREDVVIEDKMCISETTITTANTELQCSIWCDKIKQFEESTCLDNIKTEVATFEVADIQNDNVKVEEGISADDIKIEFNNGLLYCEHCEAYYEDYCFECGMLASVLNKNTLNSADCGAREDIPHDILEIQDCFGQTGIFALRIIPTGVKFGPFTGLSAMECPWELKGEKFIIDKNKSKYLNWMQYVNPTKNTSERNLHIVQCEENVYYQSTSQIQAGDELLVYFGDEYGGSSNKNVGVKDVFACTFCCLGFSSKSYLAKHKTVCVEDAAGNFSIEELTQCPFCKIHLDLKEYFEHHMAFCCERNARKGVLPTPPAKQAPTALNGRKRCLRPIYKCEQCKYRTKCQAHIKEHISNHHYEDKMCNCGICNGRFNNEEFLRAHAKNTHSCVRDKDDQEHSTTDYRNTNIKVEQSGSPNQNKIFKCSMCVFRSKYKRYLRSHIRTKHLKKFDYKCDSCDYGTNLKQHLENHVNSKHLKKFDFKCDSCEYITSQKSNLKTHIKIKHLKQFDFKCDSCEYKTNHKIKLDMHIKSKHLKQFDFKCDSCGFRTNNKINLDRHIKSKHLKQFDFKCDSCGFRTNNKINLDIHIKSKHLKQFDFKCDSCEYITNYKIPLKTHIKTKHLQKFDIKCDSCEYKTNQKGNLKMHIKTKHLKKFDFKCDSCGFRTNNKINLDMHIKSKHLKQLDFKCDSCEYKTNEKGNLKTHIKTKHLKQFDFKCDTCEYKTNNKNNLEGHIKSKHLKEFDFKCDLCEFRTNQKINLKVHIKSKHLKI